MAIFQEGYAVDFLFFAIVFVFSAICLQQSKAGKLKVNIERISAIDAIDEGVDRCTEMGRPMLFSFSAGITGTGAATAFSVLDILSYIAGRVASVDIDLNVVVGSAIGLSITRDTIREAYLGAGHPERYKADNVRYWSGGWTSTYAARLAWLYDTKPAAMFMLDGMGWGGAMFSHDVHKVGATLIGADVSAKTLCLSYLGPDVLIMMEELYGTSAYLSKDPIESSVLFAGDYIKILWIVIILVGVLLSTLGIPVISDWLAT